VSFQVTTEQHGHVHELRRATYAWFNRWFEMKTANDEEQSQAVEADETLFVRCTTRDAPWMISVRAVTSAVASTSSAMDRMV
jgi:hypothetical protein